MSLFHVVQDELTTAGLDPVNAAHREFVADCFAKATNSPAVAVVNVSSTAVEYLASFATAASVVDVVVDKKHSVRMRRANSAVQAKEHEALIFGASVLERVPFRNVSVVPFAEATIERALLSELGATGLDVLDGATLTVVCGSVLLRVSGAQSDEHIGRIFEWALRTPAVVEAIETTISENTGVEPGIVSLLAHNLSGAECSPPPIVELCGQFFAEFTFVDDVTDTSGKALAQMISSAVRTLIGAHVSCMFTSHTLPFVKSLAHAARWKYLMQEHKHDFSWYSESADDPVPQIVYDMLFRRTDNPQWCSPAAARRPLIVFSAESKAELTRAWPVISQVLMRSPRDDLPAVSEPRAQVVWRLPQQPSDSLLCVLQSGCTFDAVKMSELVDLVRQSPNLQVVDLTRANGDGITVDAIRTLLNMHHVRFISIAGAAHCGAIRAALHSASAIGRLVWCQFPQFLDDIEDHTGRDYNAHRRFFSFRQAATGSIRDIRGHDLCRCWCARSGGTRALKQQYNREIESHMDAVSLCKGTSLRFNKTICCHQLIVLFNRMIWHHRFSGGCCWFHCLLLLR